MKVVATLVSAILCSTLVAGKADHKQVARHIEKRFSGHATYFVVGLGACGKYSQPGDFMVALNTAQYGSGSPGPQCFKQILIKSGGKSAVATILDECPSCPYGSLDFSEGLFTHFQPTSVGEFDITWDFVDGNGGGGGGGGDNTPKTTTHRKVVQPTTSHTTYIPPTTSHSKPKTTSTTRSTTSSSRAKHTTTKTSATSTSTSTSTSTFYSPPTPSSSQPAIDNFREISQFILSLENMLKAATGQ